MRSLNMCMLMTSSVTNGTWEPARGLDHIIEYDQFTDPNREAKQYSHESKLQSGNHV